MASHSCPRKGCMRTVEPGHLACKRHWFALSDKTRDRLWASYNALKAGETDQASHQQLVREAVEEMNAEEARA